MLTDAHAPQVFRSNLDCQYRQAGQPRSLLSRWSAVHPPFHPDLVAKTKGTRAAACDAKDVLKRRFQAQFQERIGVRCFFPEPIHGGNSNTGNVATRVFQNSAISAEILQIPESLLVSLWELLKAISSSEFQDIDALSLIRGKCKKSF